MIVPVQQRALHTTNIADLLGDEAAAVKLEHTLGSKMTLALDLWLQGEACNVHWHEETVVAAVDPKCSQNPELVAVGWFGNLNQESHSLYLGY